MAFSLGGINTSLFSILTSTFFWIGIVIFAAIMLYIGLKLRIKRKLKIPVYIFNDLGKGKMGIEKTVCGWFKDKWLLNVYNYGVNDVCLTKEREKIIGVNTKAYHEINGKRSLIVYRKPDDRRILAPISRMAIDNEQLIMEIAPADYREASVDIVKKDTSETISTLDKYLPAIMFGFLGIILMVCIIIIVQYNKHALQEARAMVENGCKNYPLQSGATSSGGSAP
jgi:tetrahydromethanopterin S-methyltransferase subunit B